MNNCPHDLEKARRVSRATWVCPLCGEDISLMVLLWQDAIEREEEIKLKQEQEK